MKSTIFILIILFCCQIISLAQVEKLDSLQNNRPVLINVREINNSYSKVAAPMVKYVSPDEPQTITKLEVAPVIQENAEINNSDKSNEQLIESYKGQIIELKKERTENEKKGLPLSDYDRKIKKLSDLIIALEKSKIYK